MNYGKNGISAKQKKITSVSSKLSTKLGITIIKALLVVVLVSVTFVGFAGLGMIKGIIDNSPDISTIDLTPEGYATKFYNTDGEEIASLVQSGSNRISASLEEMPTHLIYAFVDIEDQRFFDHNGIDIKGIFRAAFKGITNGFHFDEGASTITQQLLKNKIFNSGMGEGSFIVSLKRKIQEQYLAIELEKLYSKEEILENYLNMINLGSNTLGVQAAAKRYFNKDVWDLTISESAVIAAITQNPSGKNPIYYPENNNARRMQILNNMLEFGHITQAEYDEAVADDVYTRIQNNNIEYINNSSVYSSFTDATLSRLISDLQTKKGYTEAQAQQLVFAGGLSVFTTQDKAIQAICDEEFQNEENFPEDTNYSISWAWSIQHADGSTENFSERSLESFFKYGDEEKGISGDRFFKLIFDSTEEVDAAIEAFKQAKLLPSDIELGENLIYTPQPQASFVVMDQTTGHVKAIVGERGEKEVNRSLNRATSSARQPGSTFKIVSTYAAALDTAGFTLGSVQYDEAGYTSPDGYPFNNYDGKYIGFCTIREAIEDSINVVAVKTIADITPSLGFSYLTNFGFSTLVESRVASNGNTYSDINYSLALGGITDGVTNLELTAAYASIANTGVYVEPILYTKVLDHSGNVLIDNTPETHRVIKDTTAFLLTSAMEDVVIKGTGTAARINGMPTAGKTGSTSDYNDVWFVGFTPYYTAGIWSGYDENKSQTGVERSYHRALWGKIMTRVHENLEAKAFSKPEGIVQAKICEKSGKLAVEGVCDIDPRGSMIVTEYYAKGTEPTESCDHHIQVMVCKDSGALATEGCPAESLQPYTYINSAVIPTKISPDAPIATNPDGTPSTEVVPVMGTSEDLTYLMPETLVDNYCPIHSGLGSPIDNPLSPDPNAPGSYYGPGYSTPRPSGSTISPTDSDPASQYNYFFGPGSSNIGYGPWLNSPQ